MSKIKTLLIANRGEIACRVMRTARAMGIKTVAVYSDADYKAPHVKLADIAINIGASPVGESYLRGDKIIQAAKDSGADAIHPGYGFLSENASFAKAVEDAGLIFIGPPTGAITVMGDKAASKRAMIAANVPCVPGYQGDDQSEQALIAEAKKIGVPVMVKAAAGGGGRGMRRVDDIKNIANAIKLARSEAKNAFGDDTLIIEKAIDNPRHVEIQVFADMVGNTIHLDERDCSVQRRHQKVLEEAPCPVMTPELREKMGEAAVAAAKAVDYIGAGTVEFLLGEDGHFYFLEMNTRLQVEHPVTELVTGLDLVALQLLVAEGRDLPLTQGEVFLSGHAIEARLYAEDPEDDFLPSTGPVLQALFPEGKGARVDSGIETGGDVSPFYDSMVAKIIGYGATREDARLNLLTALRGTALAGVKHNRDFLIDALGRDDFVQGRATTAFVSNNYPKGFKPLPTTTEEMMHAAAIAHFLGQDKASVAALPIEDELMGFSSSDPVATPYIYAETQIKIRSYTQDRIHVQSDESHMEVCRLSHDDAIMRLEINGQKHSFIYCAPGAATLHIHAPHRAYSVTNQALGTPELADAAASGTILAPMHGLLLDVRVKPGDNVKAGHTLAVLEAMKMQHEIPAPFDGTVDKVMVQAGAQVAADDLLIELNESEA